MEPHVVDRIVAPDGDDRLAHDARRSAERRSTPQTAAELTAMMTAVVESGTGTAAQIPGVAGRGQDRDRRDRPPGRRTTSGSSASRPPTTRRSRSPSRSPTRPARAARPRLRSRKEIMEALLAGNAECQIALRLRSTSLTDGDLGHPDQHALRRALPDPAQARLGRDGERLPRRGRGARPARRDQDPERPLRERRALRRALPARGEVGGGALASEHRLDLRPRRGRGHVLHRDGGRSRAAASRS